MTGYAPGTYYTEGCRSCGHGAEDHDEDDLCTAKISLQGERTCACPGWLDPPPAESRSIQTHVSAEQWVMPMHAAQRIALILDALANGREPGDRFGGASLLQYLPRTEPQPPCGAVAPLSGHYYCDSPQGHQGKHHANVGQTIFGGYEVLWKVL